MNSETKNKGAKKMYAVSKDKKMYCSQNARDAAEVAHCWAKQGHELSLYVTFKNHKELAFGKIELGKTIKETAKRLVNLRNNPA